MAYIPPVKILKASAGSGKTFSLTAHYITLLFNEHTHFSQILAITFTNKATAEMKHRILSVLESLAKGDDHYAPYKQILQQINPSLSAAAIQQKAYTIYRQLLHNYGLFSVTTIDGFVQKIIRSFSYELEIGSSYRLEMNTDKVKKDLAFRLNNLLNDRPDLLKWVIGHAREQIENGRHWNYSHTLLELAGELFKERYQPFHEALQGLTSEERLATFERLTKQIRAEMDLFETTFASLFTTAKACYAQHAVGPQDFLRKSANAITKLADLEKDSDLLSYYEKIQPYIDYPEKWQSKGLSAAMQSLYQELNPLLKRIQSFYEMHAPSFFLALALKEHLYYLNLLQEMSTLLRDYRDENGVMLISESQTLLREITRSGLDNSSFIWEKVGNHYKHFLFDEFQDTSSNQWLNFAPLLQNRLAETPPEKVFADHLFVGDVKQSIYRWRNGDWSLLERKVALDLGASRVYEETLQENYRSLNRIIDFNNFLYQHGPAWLQGLLNDKVLMGIGEERYEQWWKGQGFDSSILQAYQDSFQHKPIKKQNNEGGKVCVKILPLEKGNRSSRQNQTKQQALKALGDQILRWLKSGQYTAGQIGILIRTNQEAQEVVEHLLSIQLALPIEDKFDVLSGEALLLANNKAIKLLINSLRTMVYSSKDAAIYRANCLYLYQQLEKTAEVLPSEAWFHLSGDDDIRHWGKSLPNAIKENWVSDQQLPLSELIESLIRGYALDQSENDLPYLLAFKDLVENFTLSGGHGLSTFLRFWEEDGSRKALPAGGSNNAIEVLTIHKSKGLAFDVVMLPFCAWPLDASHLKDFWVATENTAYGELRAVPVKYNANKIGKSSLYQAFFEELMANYLDALNLLYVATTRAIRELYISVPGAGTSPSLIADLLISILEQFHAELQVPYEEGIVFPAEPFQEPHKVVIEKASEKTIRRSSITLQQTASDWHWRFHYYPSTQHLNQALEEQKIKTDLLLLVEEDPNVRLGLILHEVLAKTTRSSEVQDVLKQMQAKGLIKEQERIPLYQQAIQIIEHPELQALFNQPYIQLNEQAITDVNGQVFRPDKVLIGPEETLIIDFKFTGKKEYRDEKHFRQVSTYQSLLKAMGYPRVKAYLFYAFFQELVPVN